MIGFFARKDADKKNILFFAALIIVPLFWGLGFYLKYNSTAYISKLIYRLLNINSEKTIFSNSAFLKGYFCDICWAFSLESCVCAFLHENIERIILSLGISEVTAIILELFQLTDLISGTFDYADIIMETIAITMAGLIIFLFLRRTKL